MQMKRTSKPIWFVRKKTYRGEKSYENEAEFKLSMATQKGKKDMKMKKSSNGQWRMRKKRNE